MSTRKIRESWWVDFRHGGVRYRTRSPDDSRPGAAAYEALLRSRLSRGDSAIPKPEVPTLNAFAPQWFETWVRPNNKPSEIYRKEHTLRNHILPAFGQRRLDDILAYDIERFKGAKLAVGCSNQTVNNQINVLTRCLRSAVEWNIISAVPRIRRLRVESERLDFLTDDECQQLLVAFADERWRAMALLALRTGMRLGELLALQWQDVDLANRQLEVRRSLSLGIVVLPKSNKARRIPLTRDALQTLASLQQGASTDPVFGEPGGGRYAHHAAAWRLRAAVRRSGLRHIGWHTLRHTFASQLAIRGTSMRVIQVLLGHASVKTTEQYAHLSREAIDGALRSLSSLDTNFGHPVGNNLQIAFDQGRSAAHD